MYLVLVLKNITKDKSQINLNTNGFVFYMRKVKISAATDFNQ